MPSANKIDYFGKILIDLSDIDATPDKVLQGVNFRDKTGALQTGNIKTVVGGYAGYYGKRYFSEGARSQAFVRQFEETTCFLPQSSVDVWVPEADFGDATPADVAEGKTFTSASGFSIPGTAKLGGGGLPDVITPGDTPIIGDFSGAYITDRAKFTDAGLSVTVPKAGKYRFYISATASGNLYPGDARPQLSIKKNGAEVKKINVEANIFTATPVEIQCNANDTITVWGQAAGTRYSPVKIVVISAVACIDWTIPV